MSFLHALEAEPCDEALPQWGIHLGKWSCLVQTASETRARAPGVRLLAQASERALLGTRVRTADLEAPAATSGLPCIWTRTCVFATVRDEDSFRPLLVFGVSSTGQGLSSL
jgi:hypothetical protein